MVTHIKKILAIIPLKKIFNIILVEAKIDFLRQNQSNFLVLIFDEIKIIFTRYATKLDKVINQIDTLKEMT